MSLTKVAATTGRMPAQTKRGMPRWDPVDPPSGFIEGIMAKGEAILIEAAVNGFIVNPKEILSMDKTKEVTHVFENMDGLKAFLDEHFGKKEIGT